MELPSESGGPSCLIQYDFSKNILNITQAADDTVYALYTDLQITPELSGNFFIYKYIFIVGSNL